MSPILFGNEPLAAPQMAAPQPVSSLAGMGAAAGASPSPQGVLVPINVPMPMGGDVRCQLLFGPECAHPRVLQGILAELMQLGLLNPPQQRGGGYFDRGGNDNYGGRGRGRGRW